MPRLALSLIVSTFRRSHHLARSLASIAGQRDVDGRFEVVVADDGSDDETYEVVAAFAKSAPFPVKWTTHPHAGFRLSLARNEGASVAEAPYLVFTDGDCIFPRNHLAMHLAHRKRGRIVAGDCYRLTEAVTREIDEAVIRTGAFRELVTAGEHTRLAQKTRRARLYDWLGIPMRPRVTGSNIGVWRGDFERVNGFDQNFVGWGLEDRDLQRRLEAVGIRAKTILPYTIALHLWHPRHPTFAHNAVGTSNRAYYDRGTGPARCHLGLAQARAAGVETVTLTTGSPTTRPRPAAPGRATSPLSGGRRPRRAVQAP